MMDDRELDHAMRIDDAYVVERQLAHGPGGTTELVSLDGAGPFVRKRIPADRARRAVWALLAECRDAHLPRVHTTYELPDEFVVVYDYLPGDTLEQRVAGGGALALESVRALVADVGAALAELHAHGIVHRDVAPANIVLGEDGACLIDFGNAYVPGLDRTEAENPKGTWGFAAPEQHGFEQVDARADLYALGRVAAYALVGTMPKGGSARELHAALEPLSERVRAVIERACSFEPSARPQTAEELVAAFTAACAGEGDGDDAARQTDALQAGAAKAAAPHAEGAVRPARAGAADVAAASGADQVPTSWPDAPASPRVKRRRAAIAVAVLVALALSAAVAVPLLTGRGNSSDAPSLDAAPEGDAPTDDSTDTTQPSSSDTPATASANAGRALEALTLTETSWHSEGEGYIAYVFAIQNTSDDLLIEFPEVNIVGRDSAGNVVSSDTMVLSTLYPGEVQYCSSLAGNGSGADTVEFSIARPDEWNVSVTSAAPSTYEITGASLTGDNFGGYLAVGEVTLEQAGADQTTAMGSVAVTAIVRDLTGRAIAFGDAYPTMPAEGATATFEVPLWTDVSTDVSTGTLEVHARTW